MLGQVELRITMLEPNSRTLHFHLNRQPPAAKSHPTFLRPTWHLEILVNPYHDQAMSFVVGIAMWDGTDEGRLEAGYVVLPGPFKQAPYLILILQLSRL